MKRLTDRQALSRNRARARRMGPALFLQERVADDIQDRLSAVNRRFQAPAIVTGWPEVWDIDAKLVPDDEVLALEPETHDLVIHAMSLHWADDPVGQLIQCRRALKPDGLLIAAFPGGQTLAPLRAALAEAESAVVGGLSPRVLPMGDIRDLGGLLGRAGLALPVADSFEIGVRYGSIWRLMKDLRAMGEGNAIADRLRRPTRRGVLEEAARRYPTADDGTVRASFEIITLTGWAPDASQPQPLKRGSASHRLDDILKEL